MAGVIHKLAGNASEDNLVKGSSGNDVVQCGDGQDHFAFAATAEANGVDTLTDFGATDVLEVNAFVTPTAFTKSNALTTETGTAIANANVYNFSVETAFAATMTDDTFNAVFGSSGNHLLTSSTSETAIKAVLALDYSDVTGLYYIDVEAGSAESPVAITTDAVKLIGTVAMDSENTDGLGADSFGIA